MDSHTLALAVKAAREEARKATDAAVKAAVKEARKIVPEKGDDGYTPVKGVDYWDGNDGYTPIKNKDYFDGDAGYTPVKNKDYFDGTNGTDANRWHLVQGRPNDNFGENDDFALDGVNSDVWHKVDDEWEFVLHLKAEMPMMQPPRAYSEIQISQLAKAKDRVKVVDTDYTYDIASFDVVKVRGEAVITLPAPSNDNTGCSIEIKIQTNERVEIKPLGGLIEDEACRILNNKKYWNFRLLSDGIEWTEM